MTVNITWSALKGLLTKPDTIKTQKPDLESYFLRAFLSPSGPKNPYCYTIDQFAKHPEIKKDAKFYQDILRLYEFIFTHDRQLSVNIDVNLHMSSQNKSNEDNELMPTTPVDDLTAEQEVELLGLVFTLMQSSKTISEKLSLTAFFTDPFVYYMNDVFKQKYNKEDTNASTQLNVFFTNHPDIFTSRYVIFLLKYPRNMQEIIELKNYGILTEISAMFMDDKDLAIFCDRLSSISTLRDRIYCSPQYMRLLKKHINNPDDIKKLVYIKFILGLFSIYPENDIEKHLDNIDNIKTIHAILIASVNKCVYYDDLRAPISAYLDTNPGNTEDLSFDFDYNSKQIIVTPKPPSAAQTPRANA